jgi:hypothetical protein
MATPDELARFDCAARGIRPFDDLDWYAIDIDGQVGQFSTAGFGPVPSAVFRSYLAYIDAIEHVKSLPIRCKYTLLRKYPITASWELAAQRGLFGYDWDSSRAGWYDSNLPYELVTLPLRPLMVDELPSEVADWVSQIRFPVSFGGALYPQREFASINA